MIKVATVFHSIILFIQNIIKFLYSIGLPPELVLFIAFCEDRDVCPEDLTANNAVANSVWGDISTYIYGRNRPRLRKNIYLKWKNTSHGIRNKMKQRDINTSTSSFQVCVRLDVLSVEKRTSLITATTILREMCARLQGNDLTTKLPPRQFEMTKIESETFESDNILIVCSSVCFDLEINDKLKNEYVNENFEENVIDALKNIYTNSMSLENDLL